MSLRFLGRQNATMGGLGMAPLSLSEICKIGRYLGCVAEAGIVGYYQRYPLDGASWFRMGRECVGSGCKGCSLNLSVHTVFPITSGYQICLQFSNSLPEVFLFGAYASKSECLAIRHGTCPISQVAA